MLFRVVLSGAVLFGCTKAHESSVAPGEAPGLVLQKPAPTPTPPPTPTPTPPPPQNPTPAPKVAIELTAVTLADDCGGRAPSMAPKTMKAMKPMNQAVPKGLAKGDIDDRAKMKGARMARRCEQTSMQLAVVSDPSGAATQLEVKSAELFDEKGTSLGVLTASRPTQWASNMYQAWDQHVAPGQNLQVSYVLSQPDWSAVKDRWNGRYTLKVTLAVGSSDQQLEKGGITVHVQQSSSLPPNVKT